MYITQDIASRIKAQLKQQGKSAKDMLTDLDMGINAISEFSKGKQMSCISLARIADYLDCSVDYLIGRDMQQKKPAPENGDGLTEEQQEIVRLFAGATPELRAAALAVLKSAEAQGKAPGGV